MSRGSFGGHAIDLPEIFKYLILPKRAYRSTQVFLGSASVAALSIQYCDNSATYMQFGGKIMKASCAGYYTKQLISRRNIICTRDYKIPQLISRRKISCVGDYKVSKINRRKLRFHANEVTGLCKPAQF